MNDQWTLDTPYKMYRISLSSKRLKCICSKKLGSYSHIQYLKREEPPRSRESVSQNFPCSPCPYKIKCLSYLIKMISCPEKCIMIRIGGWGGCSLANAWVRKSLVRRKLAGLSFVIEKRLSASTVQEAIQKPETI